MVFLGLMVPFTGAILVLLLLAKLIAGKADADRTATQAAAGSLEFSPNRRSFWGVYGFIAFFVFVAIASLANAASSSVNLFVSVIAVGFVLLLLSAFPATIVVNERGLEQLFWLRGRKRIAWKEVVDIVADEKKGEVTVRGRGGVKIVHTRQLPDRPAFVAETEQRRVETVAVPVASPVLAVTGPAA